MRGRRVRGPPTPARSRARSAASSARRASSATRRAATSSWIAFSYSAAADADAASNSVCSAGRGAASSLSSCSLADLPLEFGRVGRGLRTSRAGGRRSRTSSPFRRPRRRAACGVRRGRPQGLRAEVGRPPLFEDRANGGLASAPSAGRSPRRTRCRPAPAASARTAASTAPRRAVRSAASRVESGEPAREFAELLQRGQARVGRPPPPRRRPASPAPTRPAPRAADVSRETTGGGADRVLVVGQARARRAAGAGQPLDDPVGGGRVRGQDEGAADGAGGRGRRSPARRRGGPGRGRRTSRGRRRRGRRRPFRPGCGPRRAARPGRTPGGSARGGAGRATRGRRSAGSVGRGVGFGSASVRDIGGPSPRGAGSWCAWGSGRRAGPSCACPPAGVGRGRRLPVGHSDTLVRSGVIGRGPRERPVRSASVEISGRPASRSGNGACSGTCTRAGPGSRGPAGPEALSRV